VSIRQKNNNRKNCLLSRQSYCPAERDHEICKGLPCGQHHQADSGSTDMKKDLINVQASIRAQLQNKAKETNDKTLWR
jgi:hypothetical protein